MKTSVWRVVAVGVVLALLVIAGGAVAAVTGVLPIGRLRPTLPGRVLVVVTAPNKDASQVAALPFVLTVKNGAMTATPIDPVRSVQVPGTSATTLAEAYPFGGGKAVAEAYAQLYGGDTPDWVVVPTEIWSGMVDARHGVQVDLPQGVSAYANGKLTIIKPGLQTLSGSDAVVLVSALDYFPSNLRAEVRTPLQQGVAEAIVDGFGGLAGAVRKGEAASSLRPETLSELAAAAK